MYASIIPDPTPTLALSPAALNVVSKYMTRFKAVRQTQRAPDLRVWRDYNTGIQYTLGVSDTLQFAYFECLEMETQSLYFYIPVPEDETCFLELMKRLDCK